MRQATNLIAKTAFTFKATGLRRRAVNVRAGDRFWTTSTEVMVAKTGHVTIARVRDSLHYNWPFTLADIETYFEVEPRA